MSRICDHLIPWKKFLLSAQSKTAYLSPLTILSASHSGMLCTCASLKFFAELSFKKATVPPVSPHIHRLLHIPAGNTDEMDGGRLMTGDHIRFAGGDDDLAVFAGFG